MRIPNLISLFAFALMSYSLDVSAQTDTVKVFVGGEVLDGDANGERVFNFGKKINGRRVESVSTSAKERPTL